MNKGDGEILTGCIWVLIAILLFTAVHLIALPYLIVWIFSAFGFEVSYWLGLGIWLLISFIGNQFKK